MTNNDHIPTPGTDDSASLYLKLAEMVIDQLLEERDDGGYTYRHGVDFMTNAPKFRLREGGSRSEGSAALVRELEREVGYAGRVMRDAVEERNIEGRSQ